MIRAFVGGLFFVVATIFVLTLPDNVAIGSASTSLVAYVALLAILRSPEDFSLVTVVVRPIGITILYFLGSALIISGLIKQKLLVKLLITWVALYLSYMFFISLKWHSYLLGSFDFRDWTGLALLMLLCVYAGILLNLLLIPSAMNDIYAVLVYTVLMFVLSFFFQEVKLLSGFEVGSIFHKIDFSLILLASIILPVSIFAMILNLFRGLLWEMRGYSIKVEGIS